MKHPDEDQTFEKFKHFAALAVRRYGRIAPRQREDLLQEGYLQLLLGIRRYLKKPTKRTLEQYLWSKVSMGVYRAAMRWSVQVTVPYADLRKAPTLRQTSLDQPKRREGNR